MNRSESDKNEMISYQTKVKDIPGPLVKLERLSLESTKPESLINWGKKWNLVKELNMWNKSTAVLNLKLLTDISLHYLFDNETKAENIVNHILKRFFPDDHFYMYEQKLSKVRCNEFMRVADYLRKIRYYRDLANFILSNNQKLLDR